MRTLITLILLSATLLVYPIAYAKGETKQVDFRNFQPQAFGMLITPIEGEKKRVVYLTERTDLKLAKYLAVTSRTEALIYCYATYTDIPKTDSFVALQGESLKYVVELKDGLLSSCWMSNKHLF